MINHLFDRFVNKDKQTILNLAVEIQNSINSLLLKKPRNITFEQEGFINGLEIVEEYVNEGEHGLAIEHLLYLVHESDISYPATMVEELHRLSSKFNIKNPYA